VNESVTLSHELECDMARYFTSRQLYFHEPWANDIVCKGNVNYINTLTSVISGLSYIRFLVVVS